jgi:hypothetical protein
MVLVKVLAQAVALVVVKASRCLALVGTSLSVKPVAPPAGMSVRDIRRTLGAGMDSSREISITLITGTIRLIRNVGTMQAGAGFSSAFTPLDTMYRLEVLLTRIYWSKQYKQLWWR